MRALVLFSLLSLAGCVGSVRHEGFTALSPQAFLYSAHTNAVMTANDDGEAERIRRDWIADAVQVHRMCSSGYIIESRRFVPDSVGPFANGGNILYKGRCLSAAFRG